MKLALVILKNCSYRVLIPGGKAIVINFTRPTFDKIFSIGTDKRMVENKIERN